MGFEQHLFISYAHIDNQPLTPAQGGWISRFHESLEALLSMRMGGRVQIWRDRKLQGNDVFADEIVDQLAQSAVLVSVLTPRYVNSDWCTREIEEFCARAERSGGLVIDNKARVFKVLKMPVDTQASLPQELQNTLGYEFFAIDDEVPLELDPAYGEKFAQDYNRKVGKLAWDIAQLLKTLEAAPGADGSGTPGEQGPIVYLAECSHDQRRAREILEGELRRHGYTVLPDQELPRGEEEYVAAVDRLLERCELSIHLIGDAYGGVPDGPTMDSGPTLQNRVAAARSRSDGLRRLIWLPEGTVSEQPQQQAFIDALHDDAEVQEGADLITGDLEEVKTAIRATLERRPDSEPASAADSGADATGTLQVYLLCNEKDRKATVPLRKHLRAQGLDVTLPVFEGDAPEIRAAHRTAMGTCDGVLLFYGAGDEAWKRTLSSELRKMPGYRDGRPLLAGATFLADPRTPDKDDLIDMEEPDLIVGFGDLSKASLAAFVQAMKAGEA